MEWQSVTASGRLRDGLTRHVMLCRWSVECLPLTSETTARQLAGGSLLAGGYPPSNAGGVAVLLAAGADGLPGPATCCTRCRGPPGRSPAKVPLVARQCESAALQENARRCAGVGAVPYQPRGNHVCVLLGRQGAVPGGLCAGWKARPVSTKHAESS